MEDLTKQQIILLTLFVSFVTSMATGIVTVSLMDQSPGGVTQVINRVVERTIERVAIDESQQKASQANALGAVASPTPSLSQVVDVVSKGVVRIKPKGIGADGVTGLGLAISTSGLIVTDKSTLGLPSDGGVVQDYVAVLASGEELPLAVIQSEILGDIAFATLIAPQTKTFTPITMAQSAVSTKLGDTVYALTGKSAVVLESGIIKRVGTETDPVETSISAKDLLMGSPLFTSQGEVLGIKTKAFLPTLSFYPLHNLGSVAPQITR